MEELKFEWDPNKNEINKKKHRISFEEATTVFYDEYAILFDDSKNLHLEIKVQYLFYFHLKLL